jgi:hypothetical protein
MQGKSVRAAFVVLWTPRGRILEVEALGATKTLAIFIVLSYHDSFGLFTHLTRALYDVIDML